MECLNHFVADDNNKSNKTIWKFEKKEDVSNEFTNAKQKDGDFKINVFRKFYVEKKRINNNTDSMFTLNKNVTREMSSKELMIFKDAIVLYTYAVYNNKLTKDIGYAHNFYYVKEAKKKKIK
ncbi:hypothetical protein BDAP_001716 [Binucleata daphniae]